MPGRSNDTDSVKETTDAVRRFSRESDTRPSLRLSILFDKEAAVFVSRSVDARSGEVLNQFPPEVVVRRVAAVTELLRQDQKADVDIKA